jgi:hypothetical protein
MSFSDQEPQSFFNPLRGRTTAFLLEGREANLVFASTIMALAARLGYSCAILDLDAFYSSNAKRVLRPLAGAPKPTTIRVPAPGSNIEDEFSALFEAHQDIMMIDSLNSLYHLLSLEDGSSRTRKFTFSLASLSYFARTDNKIVLLSTYVREGFPRSVKGRSMTSLSDITASVNIRGQELVIRTERGIAWPGGRVSIRTP